MQEQKADQYYRRRNQQECVPAPLMEAIVSLTNTHHLFQNVFILSYKFDLNMCDLFGSQL